MKNSNLNVKIKRIAFSRLLKSEMADYTEKAIGIFSKHEPESALVKPVFDNLNEKAPQIQLLRVSYGIDTERLRGAQLRAKLMLTISALKLKVRMASKSQLPIDIHLMENAINKHFRYLNKTRNEKELNQKVAGFFDQLLKSPELNELMSELEVEKELEAIQNAHSEMKSTMDKRVKMLSERPKISTPIITNDLASAINNLYKGIEVTHMLSLLPNEEGVTQGEDLSPLIDELSQLSKMYAKSVSIREANNKRKNKKDEEGDQGDQDAEGDEMLDEEEIEKLNEMLDDEENGVMAASYNYTEEGIADNSEGEMAN